MVCLDPWASDWCRKQDELASKDTDELTSLIAKSIFSHCNDSKERQELSDLLRALVKAIRRGS